MYLVKYFAGEYEDEHEVFLFVTKDEEMAKKYVKRFNYILKKWKLYYKKY